MNDINIKLNVVFIGNISFPVGAASSKRRRYMVDYMNMNKIQSHVLVTGFHNEDSENEVEGVYGLCDYLDISSSFSIIKASKYYQKGKSKLKEWFDGNKLNVLIFHTILDISEYPFFQFAKSIGYKVIFDQVETSYVAPGTKTSWKTKIHAMLNEYVGNIAYKKCDGSFVISKALLAQNKSKYPKMPLCLLPNSTPILQQKEKIDFNEIPIILYTGTYAPKDGVEFLIRAFLKVLEHGYKCKLVLTGRGKPSDMKVLDLVKNNPNVEYLGRISDRKLNDVLVNSDILTMTRVDSKFANCGFPFKVSEYLSTANPIIASKVSDITDYLEHKKNAYLVEPNSVNDIVKGIEFMLNNKKIALEIGKEGLHVAKTIFSIDAIGLRFVDFLHSLKENYD